MPIYEFICQSCGTKFDKLTSFDWKSAGIVCPQCSGNELSRIVSQIGGFKSSGGNGNGDSAPAKLNMGSSPCAACKSTDCSTCK